MVRMYSHSYYERHKVEVMARNTKYREKHKEEVANKMKQWHIKYHEALKIEVFSHYSKDGGLECARCGVIDIDVLCLDHINGNGGGRIRRGGWLLYRQLRKQGFPEGYQVLCANCNLKKQLREDITRAH